MTRALATLVAALFLVIAAAKIASDFSTDPGNEPVNDAWAQDRMEYVTWNGDRWTAWIHDGAFRKVPQGTGRWSRHSNASIAFIDWDGEPWQAKIDGDVFLLAKQGDWQGQVERSEALRYLDWQENKRLRTVASLQH